MAKLCPCGSTISYPDCCGMIIGGKKEAATPLELMKSRYVAFTMANADYLMSSQHSKTRRVKESKQIKKWAESVQWMGLVILNTRKGGETDDIGYVEFRAMYLEAGQIQQIHERSLFERENGKWVYVSGVHL